MKYKCYILIFSISCIFLLLMIFVYNSNTNARYKSYRSLYLQAIKLDKGDKRYNTTMEKIIDSDIRNIYHDLAMVNLSHNSDRMIKFISEYQLIKNKILKEIANIAFCINNKNIVNICNDSTSNTNMKNIASIYHILNGKATIDQQNDISVLQKQPILNKIIQISEEIEHFNSNQIN